MASIVKTGGNKDVHVILRGGSSGPNYAKEHVDSALAKMVKSRPNTFSGLMVDCSHGNSSKNHLNQPKVISDICSQLIAGQTGITGVMFESNINAGNQKSDGTGRGNLKYGVSITDACVDWAMSLDMLDELDAAVGKRAELKQ